MKCQPILAKSWKIFKGNNIYDRVVCVSMFTWWSWPIICWGRCVVCCSISRLVRGWWLCISSILLAQCLQYYNYNMETPERWRPSCVMPSLSVLIFLPKNHQMTLCDMTFQVCMSNGSVVRELTDTHTDRWDRFYILGRWHGREICIT